MSDDVPGGVGVRDVCHMRFQVTSVAGKRPTPSLPLQSPSVPSLNVMIGGYGGKESCLVAGGVHGRECVLNRGRWRWRPSWPLVSL